MGDDGGQGGDNLIVHHIPGQSRCRCGHNPSVISSLEPFCLPVSGWIPAGSSPELGISVSFLGVDRNVVVPVLTVNGGMGRDTKKGAVVLYTFSGT